MKFCSYVMNEVKIWAMKKYSLLFLFFFLLFPLGVGRGMDARMTNDLSSILEESYAMDHSGSYTAFAESGFFKDRSGGIPYSSDSIFFDQQDKANSAASGTYFNENLGDKMKLYPNPVSDRLNIRYILYEDCELILNIYDMQGKLVLSRNYLESAGNIEIKLDLDALDSGSYIIKIYQAGYPKDGLHSATKKIMKLP